MSPRTEKLLTLIGLPLMTNREAIMEEIEALSDEEFARFIAGHASLKRRVDELMRAECGSEATRTDWLKSANNEETILKEVLV